GSGAVTSAAILNGTITGGSGGDIGAHTIDGTNIVADSINTGQLTDDAVTSAKLGPNAVQSSNILNGAVNTGDLADDAVTSAKILDGEIKNADLAPNAVTGGKIQNGSLTSADIASDDGTGNPMVGSVAITPGTVPTASCVVPSPRRQG